MLEKLAYRMYSSELSIPDDVGRVTEIPDDVGRVLKKKRYKLVGV